MSKVTQWLQGLGLSQYAPLFAENEIDEEVLPELTDADLEKLGVPLGHRKKLLKAIAALHPTGAPAPASGNVPAPAMPMEPERRQVTVMFCDLVGSTALAERLDPEELRELIASYQERCAEIVNTFDGHIARYVGDGLLVYFGYPRAHEDDARRAIRAGLGVIEAIRGLDTSCGRPRGTLRVRIGIATGLVVAGDIGHGERREEKAIVGETPNLASRLQALAQPDTIVIGRNTYRLVEGLFDCEELGEQQLKGMSKPVPAYRVRGESDLPTRFEASAVRGLTPLVGRDEVIGLLLTRWAQAKESETQVVFLNGQPGIGKSRILRNFQERIQNEPRSRVLFYGSPHHRNSALYPVLDQMERGLRFEKDDGTEQRLTKLDAALEDFRLPVNEFGPLFASYLSLPSGDRYPPPKLGPDELKKKTLQGFARVYEAMASRTPLLMIVEDAHWLDPSTLELLSLIVEQLQNTRLLMAVTARPEFVSPWGEYAHVMALTLNRLSRRESAEIARRVAGKALPDEVLDEIVAKTDGVPLFVEELTKTVLESDLLHDTGDSFVLPGPLPPLAIPASLQDSLMARLDRLAPVKEIVQLAATIGRSFSHELLEAVSPIKATELQDALDRLIGAGLIHRRALLPRVLYDFKHVLIRDAAYQSLLLRTRQQFHQDIANAIEQRFPQFVEVTPEVVAHHYTEGGQPERAIPYWHRAGRRASERSAHPEAIAHLRKALELLRSLPETPERAHEELRLQMTLGPVLWAAKGPGLPELEELYVRARELCQRVGEATEHFTITWGSWLLYQQRNELEKARQFAEAVLALAEDLSDPGFRLQAHHAGWTTCIGRGEFVVTRKHAERGRALYEPDAHSIHAFLYGGHDPGVCAGNTAAVTLWFLGYPDQALERAREALALVGRLAHPFSQILTHTFASWLYQYRREPGSVREHAAAAMALCNEHGLAPQYLAVGRILDGWASMVEGRCEAGFSEMRRGLGAFKATGTKHRESYFLALSADAYARQGLVDEGLGLLEEARSIVDKLGERTWEAEIYRLEGQLLLMRSTHQEAQARACFEEAMKIARRQDAKSWELRAATSLARLRCGQGKRAEARALLAPVYAWFTEGFDTADLRDAKEVLNGLS